MNKPVCVLLWLLSLLSTLRVRVAAEGSALTPIQLAPVPCNDKAVEKLSRLATTYINEDRAEGYKFALNRVANVHLHAQVSTAQKSSLGLLLHSVSEVIFLFFFFPFFPCLTRESLFSSPLMKHENNPVMKGSHKLIGANP